MDDYPGEGPESGVGDVSSADLQSTIPDMRMTHANQLAAWTQAHEDGQYVTFASGSGSQGAVYDAQVTDIVQQAYLQSALVQSDSSADKFAVYQGPGLDKTGTQSIEDAVDFSRSVEIDHRYDVMRPKGLEIVHAVSLDDMESVYRHVTKNGSEALHVFEGNNHAVDAAKADADKSGMTEYGRVLLKHQQSQYSNPLPSGMQMAPPPIHPSKSYGGDDAATKLVATSVTNVSDNLTGIPDVDLQEEVELFDHDWGDQTRLLLFNLMTEHKLCDATISTGKFSIKLHKLVLAMSSERFASFLSNGNDTRAANVMVPLHISETTLKVFVTFLYLGKVKVSLEVVKEIKLLSMIFEIHNLEHLCYGIMVKHNLAGCSGSWPKLSVTFVNSCSKSDQSVGTEECYFRAMSELAKLPQQRKSRGKTKKGQKRKASPAIAGPKAPMPAKVSKAAPHRYGTRGALSAPDIQELSARVEPERRKTQDQPIVKQGPKARFGRIAARKIANRTDEDLEPSFEGFRPGPVPDFGDAGNASGIQEDNTELEPSVQNVGSVTEQSPIQTLKGRKQKLLESVELSRLREMNSAVTSGVTTGPIGTVSKSSVSDVSAGKLDNVTEVSCNKLGATFDNSQTVVSASLALLPDEAFAPSHHATDVYTAVKKGKKGRAKKFPLPNQVAVRPPPKKRAKMELNRLNRENDDDNDYELPMIFLSPSPSPAKDVETTPTVARIAKPKSNKKKRWPKSDITSQLSSELERMAENIEDRERQYKCQLCGNEFVFPKRSVTHLLNTHKVPVDEVIRNVQIRRKEFSPKVCDICGYKTKDPNFYYIHYHKYFRHGTPLPKGWKPFTCDICGKECFTKFQLKDHKLVHQEETPFVCEVCGTGFKSRTCFNSHVFHRHNLERKHGCPDCQKTFKTKTQRLVHMRVHSGEKPFSCPDCPYKSTTRGNMRLHLCNKHKFDPERIKDIMFQLKTQEGAGSGQAMKMFLDPVNYSQTAIVQHVQQTQDAPMLSGDSSLNVSDPAMQTDVPLTMTTSSVALDRAVNVINASEHAMHTILLPLATSDCATTAQTITTYAVETSIPLTTIATETQAAVPPMSSSPNLSPPRQPLTAATTHFYMQHSPISPPPPSDSPQAPYATSANLQQCMSPLNLQAAQVVTTTLTPVSLPPATTPDNTQTYEAGNGTNQQSYDTAMIQAYYQQQFYPHGY